MICPEVKNCGRTVEGICPHSLPHKLNADCSIQCHHALNKQAGSCIKTVGVEEKGKFIKLKVGRKSITLWSQNKC